MAESERAPEADLRSLFDAIDREDLDRATTLLDEAPALVHARDERGFTPVDWAAWWGKRELADPMLRLLTERGGRLGLHAACALNLADRVEALLREDAVRLEEPGPEGWPALHVAGLRG